MRLEIYLDGTIEELLTRLTFPESPLALDSVLNDVSVSLRPKSDELPGTFNYYNCNPFEIQPHFHCEAQKTLGFKPASVISYNIDVPPQQQTFALGRIISYVDFLLIDNYVTLSIPDIPEKVLTGRGHRPTQHPDIPVEDITIGDHDLMKYFKPTMQELCLSECGLREEDIISDEFMFDLEKIRYEMAFRYKPRGGISFEYAQLFPARIRDLGHNIRCIALTPIRKEDLRHNCYYLSLIRNSIGNELLTVYVSEGMVVDFQYKRSPFRKLADTLRPHNTLANDIVPEMVQAYLALPAEE